jgi:DNA-binding NarL/FixJ family response regulator
LTRQGTVANHVEQILGRLGPRNRAQVATWATLAGLNSTG